MSTLIGKKLRENEKVNQLISELVKEVEAINSEVSAPRDSDKNFESENKKLLDEIDAGRGRPLFYPYVGTGAGHGAYVETEDGSVKLDLINGIGVNIMGHSNPNVIAATIKGALSDVTIQGNLQPNREYHEMLTRLRKLSSKNTRLKHSWITTCGAMANENALKMCRQKNSPARKIVAMKGAFAGRSTMMAEITDNPAYKQGLPSYNEVLRVDFFDDKNPNSIENSLAQLKEHIKNNPNDISCFMFEPIQGEGGFKIAPKEFFIPLFEECRKHNIAIWADEVQTFARTGELFAIEKIGIADYIDVMTIAKSLQAAATLYTDEYNPQAGLIAGTFAGSSAALAAGNEILRMLEEDNFLGPNGRIEEIHRYITSKLKELGEGSCKGNVSDIRGMGLMVAFTPFDGGKEKMMELLKVLYKNGLIAFGCGHGPYKIRFLIPAIITNPEIDKAIEIVEKSILEMA